MAEDSFNKLIIEHSLRSKLKDWANLLTENVTCFIQYILWAMVDVLIRGRLQGKLWFIDFINLLNMHFQSSLAMFSKPKLNFHSYHWTEFVKFWKNWTSLFKSPCRRLFQYLNHFHLFQLIVQKSKVYMVCLMHSSVYRASISGNHDLAVPGIK